MFNTARTILYLNLMHTFKHILNLLKMEFWSQSLCQLWMCCVSAPNWPFCRQLWEPGGAGWMGPANISPPPVGTMTGFVNRGHHRNTATQWWQEGILGPSPPFFMQHGSPAAPQRPVPTPLWGHTPPHWVAVSPVALAMASGICLPFPWAHGLLRGNCFTTSGWVPSGGHVVLKEA